MTFQQISSPFRKLSTNIVALVDRKERKIPPLLTVCVFRRLSEIDFKPSPSGSHAPAHTSNHGRSAGLSLPPHLIWGGPSSPVVSPQIGLKEIPKIAVGKGLD